MDIEETEETDLHINLASSLNIQTSTYRSSNSIVVQRTPLLSSEQKNGSSLLTFCCANIQAVKSKTANLRDYIRSTNMDIFAITETWLHEDDTAATLEFYSTDTHSFFHHARHDRHGGGLGLLFRKTIAVKKLDGGEKSSFESSEWQIMSGSLRATLIIIYRPPYSAAHPITPRVFFDEFGSYLESVILSPGSLILTGDFNFHDDVASDPDARVFGDLLASMGLKQHVKVQTHISGHILDLEITREHDSVIASNPVADRYLCDHASVLCKLNTSKPRHVVKEVSYRQLKVTDSDELRAELRNSDLCTREFTDLNELSSCYSSILSSLLNKYAPLKRKTLASRQRVPWFNSEIKSAVRARRKKERKWQKSKSQHHFLVFKSARNHATHVMNGTRRVYYTQLIADNRSDQKSFSV